RNGVPLVDNRYSLSLTLDRSVLEQPILKRAVLRRVSKLLDVRVKELQAQLDDSTVSPYKPIAIASDVPRKVAQVINENPEDFTGIEYKRLPVRVYPQGNLAAQILGYVGEISEEELVADYFKKARPRYEAGDIVGKGGLERSYDTLIRGDPFMEKIVVDSSGKVVSQETIQEAEPGKDLITTLDLEIQRMAEKALAAGIKANRAAGYRATDAAVVVMDPNDGGIIAMANYPTYNPAIASDGFSTKEYASLGQKTPEDNTDDKVLNRAIQISYSPGSTFKIATAGAALALGVIEFNDLLPCRTAETFGEGTGAVTFHNWSSADYGQIGLAESLEISCNTFYFQLGWEMEKRFGIGLASGDETEKFQDYLHRAGFGDPTGIDLPFEGDGLVPDEKWLDAYCEAVPSPECDIGWLPGYTVNMSIGQGSLEATPLQMANAYSAIVNGGDVIVPHVGAALGEPAVDPAEADLGDEPSPTVSEPEAAVPSDSPSSSPSPSPSGETATPSPTGSATPTETSAVATPERYIRRFKTKVANRLPLNDQELAVLQTGLEDVVSGDSGTAVGAFSGFPLDRFPVAGKTGTAQVGGTDFNRAWFVGYAPADDPQYVISVYMNYAGHGGESAAPVAREIFEGIFNIDDTGDVQVTAGDASG
ncbi:MAG: hypothetical protein H0U53_07775, partial [Actinobacteria bacterium]|nr:hypothetical protein [Actinomycetota bacterium]